MRKNMQKYFKSKITGEKFFLNKNHKSFDGLFRYNINKSIKDTTYDVGYFEQDPERFEASKKLINL